MSDLLYNTFSQGREISSGTAAVLCEVKAEPDSPGYRTFLASIIAWHEVTGHKDIAALRERIAKLQANIEALVAQEADLDGDEADLRRTDIREFFTQLTAHVATLKKHHQAYLDQRIKRLEDAPAETMLAHLAKKGFSLPDDGLFAMKRLQFAGDTAAEEAIQDEFQSLNVARDPGLPRAFAAGTDYYVMELIRDTVAPDTIIVRSRDDRKEFTNKHRLNYILKAAKAVEQAHLVGVIHRTINPDTIAVDRNGKVTVIGLAIVDPVTPGADGRPYYMPPEQLQRLAPPAVTFDIYGLGASLYEYVTGEPPYARSQHGYTGSSRTATSAEDALETIGKGQFKPLAPSAIAPGIPEALDTIILKAIARDPAHRYQSVSGFIRDLEQYLELADETTLLAPGYFNIPAQKMTMKVKTREIAVAQMLDEVDDLYDGSDKERPPASRRLLIGIGIGAAALLLIIIITAIAMSGGSDASGSGADAADTAADPEIELKEMYDRAEVFAREHPDDFDLTIKGFETIAAQGPGTDSGRNARRRAAELSEARAARIATVLEKLKAQADFLITAGSYAEAAALYNSYKGPFAADTATEREQAANGLRLQQEEQASAHKKEEQRTRQVQEEQRRRTEEAQRRAFEDRQRRNRLIEELNGCLSDTVKGLAEGSFESLERSLQNRAAMASDKQLKEHLDSLVAVTRAGARVQAAFSKRIGSLAGQEFVFRRKDGTTDKVVLKGVQENGLVVEREFWEGDNRVRMQVVLSLDDMVPDQRLELTAPSAMKPDEAAALCCMIPGASAEQTAALRQQAGDHMLLLFSENALDFDKLFAARTATAEHPDLPADTAAPPTAAVEQGWFSLLNGSDATASGWQTDHLGPDSALTIGGGILDRPAADGIVVISRAIDFQEGDICFTFTSSGAAWALTLLETPLSGNGLCVEFKGAYEGEHTCTVNVKAGEAVCTLDGTPQTLTHTLTRALTGRATLQLFIDAGTALHLTGFKHSAGEEF